MFREISVVVLFTMKVHKVHWRNNEWPVSYFDRVSKWYCGLNSKKVDANIDMLRQSIHSYYKENVSFGFDELIKYQNLY